MPTYEYKCTRCNHLFEVFQKMSDEHLNECPKCGSPVKRLIGAGSGPIFKGSGFYHTDYKNNSKGSFKGKERTKESDQKSNDTKGTDTKNSDSKNIDIKKTEVKNESRKEDK